MKGEIPLFEATSEVYFSGRDTHH